MKTFETAFVNRLPALHRGQHLQLVKTHEPDDLQSSIERVITTISWFRETLLVQRHVPEKFDTLANLKNWIVDKPMISGLLLEKIEQLETLNFANPCIHSDGCQRSMGHMYSELLAALEMCQHVFFMEMAINDALLM